MGTGQANDRQSDDQPASPWRVDTIQRCDLPNIIALDTDISGIEKPDVWYGYYAALASESLSFLVARRGDEPGGDELGGYVVGGVRAWEFGSPPCGWIFAIAVRPDLRLSGLGSQLFNAITQRFAASGVQKVRTMLHVDDHLLMSFFRAHGMHAGPFVELEMKLG